MASCTLWVEDNVEVIAFSTSDVEIAKKRKEIPNAVKVETNGHYNDHGYSCFTLHLFCYIALCTILCKRGEGSYIIMPLKS